MKITYIHQYFTTPNMPGGTRSFELARRFVRSGHQVQMITSERTGMLPQGQWARTTEAGIDVRWVGLPYDNRMPFGDRMRTFMKFARWSAACAARLPADVVLATSTPLTVAIPGAYAARLVGAPLVFEVRDLWPELPIAMGALHDPWRRALARGLERFAYQSSSRVVALSPGIARGVASTGYPPERICVIPNGCDLDLFGASDTEATRIRHEHAWLQDRPLVVYAGTLGAINGLDYLVRVAAATRRWNKEIRFWLVGEGGDRDRLRNLASQLGVLDTTLFFGDARSKNEMPALLAAADMVCSCFADQPAMWSNSANKFFDGLAAAKPILLNYGGWQRQMIEDRDCGLVLPVDDPKRGAERLQAKLRDRDWLDAAGQRSRRLAREFSRDRLAAEYESLLGHVAWGGTPPAPTATAWAGGAR